MGTVPSGHPWPASSTVTTTAPALGSTCAHPRWWGLEPDLRAPESQPSGALHALEVIAEAGPVITSATLELLDRADSVTLPDGGLPFALPMDDPTACAPFWVQADPGVSSLQITAAVAAQAHRVGRFDGEVGEHPWTVRATRYCLGEISRIEEAPFAYVLSFVSGFLDAAVDAHPQASEQRARLARFVPADGAIAVQGGAEGETLSAVAVLRAEGR